MKSSQSHQDRNYIEAGKVHVIRKIPLHIVPEIGLRFPYPPQKINVWSLKRLLLARCISRMVASLT